MLWKRQAERMQGSHAGSIHLAGGPEGTAAQARPVKQERGGGGRKGQERGSEGLKEEEEAGTKLTLRPCRMHKAKTRQETSKEIILNRQQKQMDTRRREYKREGRKKKSTSNKCSSP